MERQAYIDWIREVRGKMSQEMFAQKICHFKNQKNIKICCKYHRNEVGNWEKGKNLPKNLETFLSIALFDFDKQHRGCEKDKEWRNMRFRYAAEKMQELLGQELYERNLHEMLLIQVCRGIISFQEVLQMESVLEEIIQEVKIDSETRKEYALQRETQNIQKDLFHIETKDEIWDIVNNSKVFFLTGVRTFGERMRKCFEARQRYVASISFAEAVKIYAPNYRDSFQRMFTSSGISRQWIIDLCIHLRFQRNEIQEVLKNAHFIPLSENCEDEEFYYKEKEGFPIGSASWYQDMEMNYPGEFGLHFEEIAALSLKEKIKIALLLNIYMDEIVTAEDFVPIDYLLESFFQYNCGKDAMMAVAQIQQEMAQNVDPEWQVEEIKELLRSKVEFWIVYIKSGCCDFKNEKVKSVYFDYCRECSVYYEFPKKEGLYGIELKKMRYLSALLYTVFTGRYYKGNIDEADRKEIKGQFEGQVDGWRTVYNFINQFLIIFLGKYELHNKEGRYFCVIQGEKTNSFDMEEVSEDIIESFFLFA